MTKKQAERMRYLFDNMERLGFTRSETETLRRIEMTLSRWAEQECNGDIERDGENGDGRPRRMYETWDPFKKANVRKGYVIPDKERGALTRLAEMMKGHPELIAYHQGDPRGVSLYIVKKTDLPEGQDIGGYYSRGVAVYY